MVAWEQLRDTIAPAKRLVVFLHDNPDPDALAAGWLLSRIGEKSGVPSVMVHGGGLGRDENRTMVKLLRIPVRSLTEQPIRLLKSDRFALVDTQPGTGNNSFLHQRWPCHIVIDHHPRASGYSADFMDVRPEEGCCTTMMLEYYQQCGLSLDRDLATAAAYAIISETRDLSRETTSADQRAFQEVFHLVRLRTLSRIRHPIHTRDYYRTIARAMQEVMVSKNSCVCHIGPVSQPEVVAELSDLLIPMDRITWCLVTGYYEHQMILSIRTSHSNAQAARIMKQIVTGLGKGGGHNMIAGGRVACNDVESYKERAQKITERFLKRLSRRVPENLKPLLENNTGLNTGS